jgi:hypothetical protein
VPSIGSTLLGTGRLEHARAHETQLKSFFAFDETDFAFDFERMFLST